jgi:cysteine sulfinate desulfinase/cysteine desulfurase-like protein/rhodanese-related sulfurtransferase/glyoxylase-like metal-dependent hydrolase (beta-lactamase superfamily II)
MMEIYLDANATTPVLPIASDAALAAMSLDFGNPSSTHSRGLQAKVLRENARSAARRVLGASTGQLLFVSGATEGIQTAILSALTSLRTNKTQARWLLYGATEHKAVPEALAHWNAILGLNLEIRVIPVGQDGRHDLAWLHEHAAHAGLVCTMAANNETGIISDLEGIAKALQQSPALWMVDGVQALGKLSLRLQDLPIDYAPFSGHKLYAPKGIGLLYVREGAPYTPLIVGGGQEAALRSGTENMSGIAALGAILSAIESGKVFHNATTLADFRSRLMAALREAFADVVFNTPLESSLPTTINFSVPGVGSNVLLNLFDAAGVRVSGGSACGAAKARPSYVLEAMGLPDWQIESAIRMSFGPADTVDFINEACARIRSCGDSLRKCGLAPGSSKDAVPMNGLTRLVASGACSYIFADANSRRCVVVDARPELTTQISQRLISQGYAIVAILDTSNASERDAESNGLLESLPSHLLEQHTVDTHGWPLGTDTLRLGDWSLTRQAIETGEGDAVAYLVGNSTGVQYAFPGDAVLPETSNHPSSSTSAFIRSELILRKLASLIQHDTLLLPGHDHEGLLATTLHIECMTHPSLSDLLDQDAKHEMRDLSKKSLEADPKAIKALVRDGSGALLIDVREAYEQRLGIPPNLGADVDYMTAPMSRLPDLLPQLLSRHAGQPLIFFCRSGNRSEQAARALRRLGHTSAWSLAGGVALWSQHSTF